MDVSLSQNGPLLTRAQRHEAGVSLRRSTRRGAHADWSPPTGRIDPVSTLRAQGAHRIPELLPVRYARMRVSPLAFLRGAAAVMAADLNATPTTGLRVQVCGDCHLANFGSYATPEGLPVFDINDFDETVSAPFEWDVKRLAASLVLAGREQSRPERECRWLAEAAVRAYACEIDRLSCLSPLEAWTARVDLPAAVEAIKHSRVRNRTRARLTARLQMAEAGYGLLDTGGRGFRLRERPPLVVRLPQHDEATWLAFARYAETLAPERRLLLDRYRLQDVVFKVVGVGSVGTFCAIGLFASADGETLLLQIKEAQASVLEPFAGCSAFSEAGERVVIGQRIMQAASDMFLGWNRAPAPRKGVNGPEAAERQFYVRRLKDSRLAAVGVEIEEDALDDYAVLCGRTLGRAHGRSADLATLAGYLGSGRAFAQAVGEFASLYADQTQRDWHVFNDAIAAGKIATAGI